MRVFDPFADRLAALAAVPRDVGLPGRSSPSLAGELERRVVVLRVEPRGVDVRFAVERVDVRFPVARFAAVLFAFVRLAMNPSGMVQSAKRVLARRERYNQWSP